MQTTLETITPGIAKNMLTLNVGNRTPSVVRVRRYAEEMRRGNWPVTGDSIKFIGNRLVDGQHRLLGCVEADRPFTTNVVRGLTEAAMRHIDTGKGRTTGDLLSWEGVSNSNVIGASIKAILQWRYGLLRDTSRTQVIVTRDLIADFARNNIDALTFAVADGRRLHNTIGMSQTQWGAFVFCIREANDEAAGHFVDGLITGAGLAAGSPVLAFRNWVTNSVAMTRGRRPYEFIGAGAKAWNAYIIGRPVHLLKMLPSEEVPQLIGSEG